MKGSRSNPYAAAFMKKISISGITPCLWFDGNAEEAAKFYASLFPNSHVDAVHRAPSDYPSGKAGDVLMSSSD